MGIYLDLADLVIQKKSEGPSHEEAAKAHAYEDAFEYMHSKADEIKDITRSFNKLMAYECVPYVKHESVLVGGCKGRNPSRLGFIYCSDGYHLGYVVHCRDGYGDYLTDGKTFRFEPHDTDAGNPLQDHVEITIQFSKDYPEFKARYEEFLASLVKEYD